MSYAITNRWENSKNKPVRMLQGAIGDFCTEHGITLNDTDNQPTIETREKNNHETLVVLSQMQ